MRDTLQTVLGTTEGICDAILINAHYTASGTRRISSLHGLDIALKLLENKRDDRVIIIYSFFRPSDHTLMEDSRYKQLQKCSRVIFTEFPLITEAFVPILKEAKKRRARRSSSK